ncbi:MAG: hypothetical protein IKO39_11540 [Treponema sp.]|nr:hypothetical protein [Treponema sp.]MBR4600665.1 hypothetical protein [Treponema sp.]
MENIKSGSSGDADVADITPDEINLNVNDDEYDITFWTKQGAVAKDGKYSEYIALLFRPNYGDGKLVSPEMARQWLGDNAHIFELSAKFQYIIEKLWRR